ncbi:hypothetical protein ND747_12500, partial [Frankia sp. R82]|nr:hypothetical protein [Frankia sp. R82]
VHVGVPRAGAPRDAPTVPLGTGPQVWATRSWAAPPGPDPSVLGDWSGSEVTAYLTRPRQPARTREPGPPGGPGGEAAAGGATGSAEPGTPAAGESLLPVVEPGPPGARDAGRA